MALSKVTAIGNGVTNEFAVNFALGYIGSSEINCRVGTESDGAGNPVYRTITFVSSNLANISGAPPGLNVPVVFSRVVPKDSLIINFDDGDILTEANLDTSQKQTMMAVHEALDDSANALLVSKNAVSDIRSYIDNLVIEIGSGQDVLPYPTDQITLLKPLTATPRSDATRWASRIAVAGADYGLDINNAQIAINNIAQALDIRGGGIIELPNAALRFTGVLDNKYSRVLIRGSGRSLPHDAGSPTYGTRFIADASMASTVLPDGSSRKVLARHRTPYGSGNAKNSGGGFEDIMFDANGVAQNNLIIDSISGGKYRLLSQNAIGTGTRNQPGNAGIIMTTGRSGIDLAEACDTQFFKADFHIRQLDGAGGNVDGVQIDGSVNANVSGGDLEVSGQFLEGHLVHAINVDNVDARITGYRPAGGGLLLYARGDKGDGRFCRALVVHRLGSNGVPWLIEGTDTAGVTRAAEVIYKYRDFENGCPDAILGTGALRYGDNGRGGLLGYGATGFVTGQTEANMVYAKTLLTNQSSLVHNNSGAHIALANDSGVKATVGLATDGSNDILFVFAGRTIRFKSTGSSTTV